MPLNFQPYVRPSFNIWHRAFMAVVTFDVVAIMLFLAVTRGKPLVFYAAVGLTLSGVLLDYLLLRIFVPIKPKGTPPEGNPNSATGILFIAIMGMFWIGTSMLATAQLEFLLGYREVGMALLQVLLWGILTAWLSYNFQRNFTRGLDD